MNLKSGTIERFQDFSQFSTLEEFNHHIERWLLDYKKKFSKGELVGLKRLVRFAAKIPGVCNAKIGTILKAIHAEYNDHGISRSTFKRMIVKAKSLGIIAVYETERKNGSQSSNLYIFNRYPASEPPKHQKMNHPNKTSNLSKTNKNHLHKKRQEAKLDYTYTNDRVPKPFIDVIKYFFADANTIEEFWRMTMIAAYRHNCENETDQVLSLAIVSLKQLMNKLKSPKTIKNPIAYYYGIVNKKLAEHYFAELFALGFSSQTNKQMDAFFASFA